MKDLNSDDQSMSRKTSSNFDFEELKKEAEEMGDIKIAEDELKKKLMFDQKNISICRLYGHLMEKLDYFLVPLALIGSIFAGIAMPVMAYYSSDLMGDIGNTSEYADDPLILIDRVKDVFNTQIKRFFIFGVIAFVANFLAICCWTLAGSRM